MELIEKSLYEVALERLEKSPLKIFLSGVSYETKAAGDADNELSTENGEASNGESYLSE